MSRADQEPKLKRIQVSEATLEEIKSFSGRLNEEVGTGIDDTHIFHLEEDLLEGKLIAFKAIDATTKRIVGIIAGRRVGETEVDGSLLYTDPTLPELQIGSELINHVKSLSSRITLIAMSYYRKYPTNK